MPQLIASVQGVEVKHVQLSKPRTTLGRKPGNDIVLDNMVVSGEHCVFELEGLADVWLRDLGSTNGTYINDHMAKARVQLHDGDIIAIGPFRIRYVQENERPESQFGGTTQFSASDFAVLQQAAFQVMSGTSAGLTVPVVKAVTTFGRPGVCVVSVSHRRNGYFVSHLAGETVPMLNGKAVADEPMPLADKDVLDLAGTKMLFMLEEMPQ
ncbi:FHA domain-containing protein [Ramlibacter albus]|uniref:FHA domain-containing protein n=1 Tax=Ramlibacter albus TaxID=2079448 RepID=A0A923S1D8_9BURK|nr:FHA domain-containing protein [Ramlibacter albus]MBC5764180.1 FHA domain-containing protein [Ramlibacter albus]